MDYFMDELESWEVYDLYSSLQFADSALWEQTRWLMYIVALVNSKKKLNLTDILKFPWDGGTTTKTTITNEEIARLKKKAQNIGKDLFDGKANI